MAKAAKRNLPAEIYAVEVTVKLLVPGYGFAESERLEDARKAAAQWAGKATVTVSEPKRLSS